MRWNPYINALGAAVYVWGIGSLLHYVTSVSQNTPDTVFDPIAAISLLVFSVAIMGFFFCYRPVSLLIENKKKEALSFFGTTLATFGAITVVAIVVMLR